MTAALLAAIIQGAVGYLGSVAAGFVAGFWSHHKITQARQAVANTPQSLKQLQEDAAKGDI